jgi:SAM-dependent methyltransferase
MARHWPANSSNFSFEGEENMSQTVQASVLIEDELAVLTALVPLKGQRVTELGCGSARLARTALDQFTGSEWVGLEVDERQHAKNVAAPQDRLQFVAAGAQEIPFGDASFDLAVMLKSLHHVPLDLLAQALTEIARVLRPGGHLYVSEPVYAGDLNTIIRHFNDEGFVRAAAQHALDQALQGSDWTQVAERRFDVPVHFRDFADFEQRMMRPTYADHQLDETKIAAVRSAFEPHCSADGARFTRPMHVRLLKRS